MSPMIVHACIGIEAITAAMVIAADVRKNPLAALRYPDVLALGIVKPDLSVAYGNTLPVGKQRRVGLVGDRLLDLGGENLVVVGDKVGSVSDFQSFAIDACLALSSDPIPGIESNLPWNTRNGLEQGARIIGRRISEDLASLTHLEKLATSNDPDPAADVPYDAQVMSDEKI